MQESMRCARILNQLSKVIVGKREALETIMLSILSDGHVLIEDYPGLAKTLMAKSFASALGLEFTVRVTFSFAVLMKASSGFCGIRSGRPFTASR